MYQTVLKAGFSNRLLALLLAVLLLISGHYEVQAQPQPFLSFDARQAAQILGIQDEIDRLISFRHQQVALESEPDDILGIRTIVLHKIMLGFLDVRKATNNMDVELAYTYDIMQRQQRKENAVNQLFNAINFVQFGTTYAIEGHSRINKQFTQSSDLTCVSSGLGLGLPTLNILHSKYAKAKDIAPPKFLATVLTGGPVDAIRLPDCVDKYMNLPAQGSSVSRKNAMYSVWKQEHGIDIAKKGALCSLTDGKPQSTFELNNRIVLLWSFRTYVTGFDRSLHDLLEAIKAPGLQVSPTAETNLRQYGLSASAAEAAKLIGVQPEVAELMRLKHTSARSRERLQLEAYLLERALSGVLDVRVAANKIYEELNYSFDVALSQLLTQRGKWLQRNFELNFMQTGTMGAVAGLLYLNGYTFAGNDMFLITNAIGTVQSTLTLALLRGGCKKIVGPPNSLADFFNLHPAGEYKFSPLISQYLNSPDPESKDGKTRKEELNDIWKRNRVSTMNVHNKKNEYRLAAFPPAKCDTISVLTNRIALLQSVQIMIEYLHGEFLDLLNATKSNTEGEAQTAAGPPVEMSKSAANAANLLNVKNEIEQIVSASTRVSPSDEGLIARRLALLRATLSAVLEVRSTAAKIGIEIAGENQILSCMTRTRDKVIALTNNANFYQIGILGMIIDGPLGLTTNPYRTLYGNRLTILSGLMACGLAGAAFLEQHGGLRLSKAPPNMLGECFGIQNSATPGYSPLLLKYLNTSDPNAEDGLTRKQELLTYWKKAKVLNINVVRHSSAERLCATGGAHHFWNEDMRLLRNRLTMLYDLHAMVDTMENGLSDMLQVAI